jgi:hypothetical protein
MKPDLKTFLLILATLAVVFLGYIVLNTPEHRTVGDKVNDAVHELQDRTPAQKIKDNINEATDKK